MRWSMVPISIAAHAAAAVALFIVPLAQDPVSAMRSPLRVTMRDIQLPPATASSSRAAVTAARARVTAPVVAPTAISPEAPASATAGPAPPGLAMEIGIADGVLGGIGTIAGLEAEAPAPIAAPDPPRVVHAGQGIREPKKIFDVAPHYPDIARTAHVEGVVILEAVISARGAVERVKVLRSVPLLDSAAIDAVQRWRYTPTLLNGTPVSVLMTITVRFQIHD
jgi:protein TonB